MRILATICLLLLVPGLILAQSGTPKPDSTTDNSAVANELKALREALAEQQKQIARQQQEIERLKQQQAAKYDMSADAPNGTPRIMDAVLHTTAPSGVASPAPNRLGQGDEKKESPLSFKIGGADFTPGGFMDFTTIFRSTNTGNPGGTNFFAIPFNNDLAGHLTETRFSAQNSRLSLKATSKFGENNVTGYAEMDFLGNDAANVFVTSNSHTFRQRLYWLDLKRGKWEFLAGQSWSWLTPNRVGLSPAPADIFYSQNEDFNYQVGLTWTRAPQFRVAYHPNDNWALGVALENPQQFTGQGAEVTFPNGGANNFNAQLSVQFDAANNSGTPNLHPDIIPKIAYDNVLGGKHFHAEAAGLLTTIKITNLASGVFVKHSKTGGGVSAAVNLELVKNFRIVANGFLSDGGGRYIFGMGPDVVVRAVTAPGGVTCTSTGSGLSLVVTGNCDLKPSLVHSGSGIFGFEGQVTPKTMFYGYYGGAYFQRNFFPDITGGTAQPLIGFGGPGVGNARVQNRAIQEGTLGWIQTFWKNPQYGALQFITQASYLTRSPWFVAAGAPKNAHLGMGWVDLRYVLP